MTTYKVTGETSFMGYQPGEEFEAELHPEQERRAKERGSIKAVKAAKDNKKEEGDG